jgi:DUF4097 and DUF4098 domain-containing protein YvlB
VPANAGHSVYSMTRRALAATLIAAAAATTLAGCGGVGATLTFNDVEKVKVTEIKMVGNSGDVAVKTAAIAETRITRIIEHSSDPGPSYKVEGTVLSIDTNCGPDCRADYDITAPEGVKVTGKLSSGDIGLTAIGSADVTVTSGDILVQGATGDVRAVATSGDLNVTQVAGKTTLQSTSGDARALDVRGPVDVRVTSGDVTVHSRAQNSITANATSGNVNVTVPRGGYRINIDANSGDEAMTDLVPDPASKFTLDLHAGSGDVMLTADPAA